MSLTSPPPPPEQRRPRPHQQEALQALSSALRHGGRAQLLADCGTGKTLIGRWLVTELAAHRTVVLVPSLALVAQTLAEWRRCGPHGRRIVVLDGAELPDDLAREDEPCDGPGDPS